MLVLQNLIQAQKAQSSQMVEMRMFSLRLPPGMSLPLRQTGCLQPRKGLILLYYYYPHPSLTRTPELGSLIPLRHCGSVCVLESPQERV